MPALVQKLETPTPPPPDREQGWDDLGEAVWPAGPRQGEKWPAGFSQWSGKAPRRKC